MKKTDWKDVAVRLIETVGEVIMHHATLQAMIQLTILALPVLITLL